jgi:hypothetical protein
MAISFPLAWPTHTGVTQLTISENNVVAVSSAPMSGIEQVQEHPGQWWLAEVSWPPMERADTDIWMATLSSLRGRLGTILIPDISRAAARGSAATTPGSPVVSSGSNNSLTISTGLGSVTGYLKANDRISLGTGSTRRLHKVLSDVNLSSGSATIDIWPRLRSTPSGTVYVANASGRFRLTTNRIDETRERNGLWRLPTLTFREALD